MKITDFTRLKEMTSAGRKFGKTYLVEHQTTQAKGILKLIPKAGIEVELLQQLKQEATFSFSEKGLPEIWCSFENENYFSFVKKYQEGILWEEYINQISKKDFYRHLPLAVVQLIELLQKVHQSGWLHGDIKPSNVLIQANSPTDFQMEIIDFGMSFRLGQQPNFKLPFSLGFSAPELLLNHRDIANETTDFYSLGITILNLITGEIPLQHPNPELFINLQLTHPILRPHSVPKSLWEVIQPMVIKPVFPLPPNQMEEREVTQLLSDALSKRPNDVTLLEAWKKIEIKKGLFGYH